MFHSGFIKDTEKVVLYIISERLDTNLILSRSRLKNFCVCFYHTTSFWGALNINYEINRAHLKMRGPFHSVTQFSSWFSKKKKSQSTPLFISKHACTKSLEAQTKCFQSLNYLGLVVFINRNMYMLGRYKESGVSKHSWKKILQLFWTVVFYVLKER